MFFADVVKGKKVIKSTLMTEVEMFFTTREICIFSKDEDMGYNKRIVEEYLGVKLATNHPVHGIDVAEVVDGKYFYEDVDGLLLKKGMAGFLNFGDCVPLVFYVNGVAIISHAGWRGTAKSMAKVSVKKMIEGTGCRAEDIKAVIGPSICYQCYEVGKEVFEELFKTVKNKDGLFKKENGKYFVDLKGINKRQLEESGVMMFDVCPYCTNCGEKMFYSYRYEKTGYRHSAVVKV